MAQTKTPPSITTFKDKALYMTKDGFSSILRLDGKDVKIPFCLPGETVEYDEVKRRRKTDYYYRGIEKASPNRIAPICQHFSTCGGCLLQHMNHKDYSEYKKSIVTQLFADNGLDPFVIENPTFLKAGIRRRANMDAVKKNGETFFGFHKLKSYSIINIQECPVLHPELERILVPLKEALHDVLNEFQKAKVFMTHTSVGIDLSLEIQEVATLTEAQQHRLLDFAKEQKLCRFLFRYRKTLLTIYEKETPYVDIDGVQVSVDPWSFLQASSDADHQLTAWVLDALPKQKNINIADLFCGRGTFTFPLSRFGLVTGYENDKKALAALSEANKHANRSITVVEQNLFESPVVAHELSLIDVIVIDPPRAGAEAQCKEIIKSKVPSVIYVSCNPETFTRDAKILRDGGYALKKVYLLDQFIYTPHIECVGIFTKTL